MDLCFILYAAYKIYNKGVGNNGYFDNMILNKFGVGRNSMYVVIIGSFKIRAE
jgi:hypothetical protein